VGYFGCTVFSIKANNLRLFRSPFIPARVILPRAQRGKTKRRANNARAKTGACKIGMCFKTQK